MSDKTEAQLLSPERLEEIRKPYAQWMLDEASLHEIRYRSDSTNTEAPYGPAKLIALDLKDLVAHIEAQRHFLAKRDYAVEQAYAAFRQQVAAELAALLQPEVYAEPEPGERTYALHPDSQREVRQLREQRRIDKIRAAATRLGLDLSAPTP